MSREDIIAVAVRLFAVFLALLSLRFASQALLTEGLQPAALAVWLFAGTAAPLAAAVLLWNFPLTVAGKLLPVMRTPGTPISAEGASAFGIGCTLLGLWLFALALPGAAHWAVFMFTLVRQEQLHELNAEHWGPLAAVITELAVAIWLMLGHRGIHGAIRRLRGADTAG